MASRRDISLRALPELHVKVRRRIDELGVESRPEVALKLMEMIKEDRADAEAFAVVISADAALTGRLLEVVNSPAFGQPDQVTSIERACVLLGLSRLRTLALGCCLSRTAAGIMTGSSQAQWGMGVYRACLAQEIARLSCPGLEPEAFIIGLLMDAGAPLLDAMALPQAAGLGLEDTPLIERIDLELDRLPFTHADVAACLCERWSLPELLSKPVRWRYDRPARFGSTHAVHKLHRVAYVVGRASDLPPAEDPLFVGTASEELGLDAGTLAKVSQRAAKEYAICLEAFKDVARPRDWIKTLLDDSVEALTEGLMEHVKQASEGVVALAGPARFRIGGLDGADVEVVRVSYDEVTLALLGRDGVVVATHPINLESPDADGALGLFELTPASDKERDTLVQYLVALADEG